jgi:hypothetical protein
VLDSSSEMLTVGDLRVPRWIAEPLIRAAHLTAVDPAYLMAVADKESSLRPSSRARTSSAQGLFQFVEDTWLYAVRRYAPKYGLTGVTDAVSVAGGRPIVADEDKRTWLMNLRCDPYMSALMAAEMIKEYRNMLAEKTERTPSNTELYMAHFLGPNGAARFLDLLAAKPKQSARNVFPSAARANQAIFYEVTKRRRLKALSLDAVWARLERMMATRVARYAVLRGSEAIAAD